MPQIAILIDAENVLPQHAEQIFTYAESLGTIVRKEIFGASSAMTTWVEPVLKYALHPNLTIKASKGKNTSDISLVIGAMDLLAEHCADTIIIASSDSDFSLLSVRLRSAGLEVVGMGTDRANPLWRTACSSFVTLSLRQPARSAAPAKPVASQPPRAASPVQPQKNQAQPKPAVQPQPVQNASGSPSPAQVQDTPASQPAARPVPEEALAAAPKAEPTAAAPARPAQSADAPSSKTHSGRAAIIRSFILSQISASGGSVPSSALFASLNTLPEYRVDQQRSRRKPLNYLQRQFGDVIRIDEREDGTFITSVAVPEPAVTVQEAPSASPAPETQKQPDTADRNRDKAGKKASSKKQKAGKPAAEPAQKESVSWKDAVDAKAAEVHSEEPSAPVLPAAAEPETADPRELTLLMEAGLDRDDAVKLMNILNESSNLRQAYNRIRSAFGNKTGNLYYAKVKEIASREADRQLSEKSV